MWGVDGAKYPETLINHLGEQLLKLVRLKCSGYRFAVDEMARKPSKNKHDSVTADP